MGRLRLVPKNRVLFGELPQVLEPKGQNSRLWLQYGGWRIEVGADFDEAQLSRLMILVEQRPCS